MLYHVISCKKWHMKTLSFWRLYAKSLILTNRWDANEFSQIPFAPHHSVCWSLPNSRIRWKQVSLTSSSTSFYLCRYGVLKIDHLEVFSPCPRISMELRHGMGWEFFSRVHVTLQPDLSVGRSVGHTLLFYDFITLTSLLLPKWSGDFKYGPCPPARDWGSRVSGLVFWSLWK